ncbi:hypothetical protein FRC03_011929 [Tulasnella sp. 419]|nr:hypothetical protein FRC03_011929 [Tulasnella sp. 419]
MYTPPAFLTFPSGPSPPTAEMILSQLAAPSLQPRPTCDAPMRDSIAFVLCCAPNGTLLSSEIKERVWRLHEDHYRANPEKWKTAMNTIRHHLSNCVEFEKAGKPKVGRGRGQLWKLVPEKKRGARGQRKKVAAAVTEGFLGIVGPPSPLGPPPPPAAHAMMVTQAPTELDFEALAALTISSSPASHLSLPPLDIPSDFINYSPDMSTTGQAPSPSTLSPVSSMGNPVTPPPVVVSEDFTYSTFFPQDTAEVTIDPVLWDLFVKEDAS